MNLFVYLKTGEILKFKERPESSQVMGEMYKYSLSNKRLLLLHCTNGDFLINPSDVSYMIVTPDQPLEPDQLG